MFHAHPKIIGPNRQVWSLWVFNVGWIMVPKIPRSWFWKTLFIYYCFIQKERLLNCIERYGGGEVTLHDTVAGVSYMRQRTSCCRLVEKVVTAKSARTAALGMERQGRALSRDSKGPGFVGTWILVQGNWAQLLRSSPWENAYVFFEPRNLLYYVIVATCN